MKKRGLFFVLEGLDGAGTTTQAARLVERLGAAGHRVHATAEPSRGSVGLLIREVLGHRVKMDRQALALLFAADRLDHVEREVRPLLESGEHVVSDRYLLSSLAYQSLDAPRAWVADINARAPAPDLTLLLRVPAKVALERRRAAGGAPDLFETLPQLRRVARAYDSDARVLARAQRVRVLDGEAPIEEVEAAVWREVSRRLARG